MALAWKRCKTLPWLTLSQLKDADRLECFVQMLRSLREPLLLASRDGRILAANVAAAEALSTSMATLEGATLATYSPAPGVLAEQLRALEPEMQFTLRGRDGRRFLCDTNLLDPNLLLVRLSGGQDAETRSRMFRDELTTLSSITTPASVGHEDGGARALFAQGMSAIGAIAGGLFLTDKTGSNLELICSVGYTEEAADRYRIVPLTAPLPLIEAVKQGEPIFLGTDEFAMRYPVLAQTRPQLGRSAMACVPLEIDGRSIGVLGLGFPLPWTFSEEDRHRLRAFAAEFARAFDRAHRAQPDPPSPAATDRATARLERLHAFTAALARAITPSNVAAAVVDMGMAATSARSGGLWLLSDDGTTVTLVRGVGPSGPRAEDFATVPIDRPLRMPILDAIRDATPVWIESCGQLEERYPEAFRAFSKGSESSLACVPLFAQGRCIGGLAYNFEGARRFLEDERAFLQVLSRHSAQAIERARLYSAERRAREEAEANERRSAFLSRAGTLLASSLDYVSTLAAVAQSAVPGFADWCIVELEEERLRGESAVAAHVDPTKVSFVLELSRRIRGLGKEGGIGGVISSGRSKLYRAITADQIYEGLSDAPEIGALLAGTGIVSSMVVPIAARGRTLGAIVLNSARPGYHYDEHDLETAEELGRRIGLAVDNARLFRDAREADRLKDEFLAMLSHELRNPLAPIVSALDMMTLRGGDTFTRERTVISRHVRHLLRLVDDLLDVSRVTRGKIQLELVRCDLSDVVAEALEMASSLVEERSHHLTVSMPEDAVWLSVDRVRLTQAVANLVINSAKYSEPGGAIDITATTEGSEAVIRVRDAGRGIAPESLPRIFDLFVQERWPLDRTQGGLGIGLTVVKSIVELHRGSVSVHSEGLGRGSEFVIRLPRGSAEPPPPASDTPPDPRGLPDARLHVLVVDDNEDAAIILGEALEMLGCSTQITHDGASAIAAFNESHPDLVLLDIGLPDISGYEVARRICQAAAATRIIAITGYGQDSDRVRSRDAGFSEHLTKPIDLDTLNGILARYRHLAPTRR